MKKNYFLLGLLVGIILLAFAACSSTDVLTNTSWKLHGFYSHETDSLEIAQPDDCEYCYVINFQEDEKFSGRTTTNEFEGRYTISDDHFSIHDFFSTKVGDMFDEDRFYSALHEATRYSISNRQLRLYYNNQDYLLFNVR
jgi:heat shock protein HslJ